MFNDIGALELVTLVVLAVLVFGPDKLPKVIQDVTGFIRKVRQFSDNAKQDIRTELGPEFKDFEFEDLNPKTFVRKHLGENDDLKELRELGTSFDLRKEINEVADAVNAKESPDPVPAAAGGSAGNPDLLKKPAAAPDPFTKRDKVDPDERAPFDADAT
ncbi:sec-independent translocase [Streptomyces amakusaensis]|uniref:Sec-independent protein translocase protein TatB n=1 Tax=Streptomyces amakusaensis TaxID=67271 RepID=A0ABW0AAX1_9ACTN